jgi:MYXO-CTERM domain-containing protein
VWCLVGIPFAQAYPEGSVTAIDHKELQLSQRESYRHKTTFSTWVGTGLRVSSFLLLPLTTPTFAQTPTPRPETRPMDTRVEHDRTGLWGLLGLAGLLGLTGLGRRRDDVHASTDPRARSKA